MAAHTDNEIVIAAPPDITWDIANDLDLWPELFRDEYQRIETLHREPDRAILRLTTLPDDGGQVRTWRSERCFDREHGTATARRLDLGPFRYMHIFHSVTAVPGGARLRWVQDFEVRPDVPFDDHWMATRLSAGSQVNLLQHKRFIEHARTAPTGMV